jgi:AraC-like DNA-binding protein
MAFRVSPARVRAPVDPAEYWRPPECPFPQLPELAYFGRYSARAAVPMGAHRHPSLEVCYIERGMAEWWVERRPYTVRGGHFFLIRPHELHGGINHIHQPCRYFFMGVLLSAKRLLALPGPEARALRSAFERPHARCFPAPADAARAFGEIHEAVHAQSVHAVTTVRTAVLQILLGAIRESAATHETQLSPVVSEAVRLMDANLNEPLRLDALARRAGWSTSYLKRRFFREIGTSPAEFYLRRRIARACEQLRESDTDVTDIAVELGFGSSQYFATAFKRTVGMTPRAYRACRDGSTRYRTERD